MKKNLIVESVQQKEEEFKSDFINMLNVILNNSPEIFTSIKLDIKPYILM